MISKRLCNYKIDEVIWNNSRGKTTRNQYVSHRFSVLIGLHFFLYFMSSDIGYLHWYRRKEMNIRVAIRIYSASCIGKPPLYVTSDEGLKMETRSGREECDEIV